MPADSLLSRLDFLYMPSVDPAAEAAYFVDVLGAELVFAVEGMGARVAMLRLGDGSPRILLADHLEGERPVLVYRVANLADARQALSARGWTEGVSLEIPFGPVSSFRTPGGQRLAIYELTRPGVEEHFVGRRDF
ncbi:MAG: VOC family protein [Chloroflexota bacterium]